MSDIPMKRCTKGDDCIHPNGPLLPATKEYFNRDRSKPGGLKYTCKACMNTNRRKLARKKGIPPINKVVDGEKKCPRCQRTLPFTTDYFNRNRSNNLGLGYICKDCHKQRLVQYRRSKGIPQKNYPNDNGDKQCPGCGNVLPFTAEYFNRNRSQKYGLSARCKECTRKASHIWSLKNKDRKRIYSSEQKIKRANYSKRRRRQKPHHRQVYGLKKLSVDLGIHFDYSVKGWIRCLDYFDHSCAYCGAKADMFRSLQADHYTPISDENCPGTIATNMLPACSSDQPLEGQLGCNQSKGAKDPETWLIERFGKRKANRILKRIREYFDWVREQDGE